MSVASMSNVTGAEPAATPRRAHTPARTPAIAAHRSSLVGAPTARTVRYSVGADATSANSAPSARRYSISLTHSPPPASINIA